ncbi:MAG: preprotein translocase subunit YajC [Actinomycetota bacterium]
MDYILLGVLAVMILLLVQQNRRRKKDADNLVKSLEVGASVILHSGIKGTVAAIEGDDLIVESTPKTKIRVVKGAVRAILPVVTEEK